MDKPMTRGHKDVPVLARTASSDSGPALSGSYDGNAHSRKGKTGNMFIPIYLSAQSPRILFVQAPVSE
jgi:hypothetical protein